MSVTCYECDRVVPAGELSPRSRCVTCEHRRAKFNERENEKLRTLIEGTDRGGAA